MEDAFHSLALLHHNGLSSFVGRGLPSIWSAICSEPFTPTTLTTVSFNDIDAKNIREWARQLDEWFIRYHEVSRTLTEDPHRAR